MRLPILTLVSCLVAARGALGAEGRYRNPVLFGDYSDPDVVRAGDGFYLVSSSFSAVPGLPVLFSSDLVGWTKTCGPRPTSCSRSSPRHPGGPLDAIPSDNEAWRTVLVRNGTYREKVHVSRGHIALVGEDRGRTRIEYAELRRNWRASHPDDWGAAVVNIGPEVTDLVLAKLTVCNDYGGVGGDHDHQFAVRSMGDATRIALLNVAATADEGDTVSLWNSVSGLSCSAGCYFEGWVEYFCPRGWACVTDSRTP